MGISDERQITAILQQPIAKNGFRHMNGSMIESNIQPCPLLSRSAISPPSSLMSTSAPPQRNPLLHGRGGGPASSGDVFFPAL